MERAYMETIRHPNLSLWQSAVYEYTRQKHADKPREQLVHASKKEPMMLGASNHIAALAHDKPVVSPSAVGEDEELSVDHHADLSRRFHEHAEAKRIGDEKTADRILEETKRKYSKSDLLGWASCVTVYLEYSMGRDPIYRSWQQEGAGDINWGMLPWKLDNDAKVGVIGDWGTGLADAKALVEQMLTQLDVDAIIHIGDIYYSGTPKECNLHVYELFEEVFSDIGRTVPVMTIPGNHDYYARGEGFYPLVDDLKVLTESGQVASFFGLRTDDGKWQILAGDTGLQDRKPQDQFEPTAKGPGLPDSEIRWHHDKLEKFDGNTVLMTHHQLFSPHGDINKPLTDTNKHINGKLLKIFQPYFDRISGWMWGHEHNYAMYQQGLLGLSAGRLVGNGGYEIEESEDPYKVDEPGLPLDPESTELDTYKGFYNHGCAVLDFKREHPDDPIEARYYQFPSWGDEAPSPAPQLELLDKEALGNPHTHWWRSDEPVTGIDEPKTNDSMQAVEHDGTIITVFKGAHSNRLRWASCRDGVWEGNEKLPIKASSNRNPGMAVYDGRVCIVYKGAHSNDLYVGWFDGAKWSGNNRIKDISSIAPKSDQSPRLVPYGDRLCMVYTGAWADDLYVAWYDGSSWTGNQKISKGSNISPKSNYAPGMALYDGDLLAFYKGAHSNDLFSMTYDGKDWSGDEKVGAGSGFSPKTNYNPQPVVSQGTVHLLYKGAHSKELYSAAYDGEVWSGNIRLKYSSPVDPRTPYEPALVYRNGSLVALYAAADGGQLRQLEYGRLGG